jgi:hypothetical protein
VIIVDGASFRGRIDMGEVDVEGAREETRAAAAPAARPAPRPTFSRPAPVHVEPKKVEERVAPSAPAAFAPKPPAPPAPVAMGAVKRKVIVKRK